MEFATLDLSNNELAVAAVFTPIKWAQFAIEKFGIFSKWMDGASVFDPTMGEGNLLQALIDFGLKKGFRIDELPTHKLFGNELNTGYYKNALTIFREKYNLDMGHNFWNTDILNLAPRKFDMLFGNPPWQNFVDLPDSYKSKIKPEFFKYDLIENSRDLLLGGSRIDIAALIIQKSIKEFLNPAGSACFFMPLSLLLNDGANKYFRTYRIYDTHFSIEKIYDFNDIDVFDGIATRYGLVHFRRDTKQSFPITYKRFENEKWAEYAANPLFHSTDPLSIMNKQEEEIISKLRPIILPKESAPRQGVNTCGANSIFFFNEYKVIDDKSCVVSNDVHLPKKYVYPLLTSKNFRDEIISAKKWVLLPYSKNGKPLEKNELAEEPLLLNYLLKHEKKLKQRKGLMIGAWIKKGYWWALLGVGPYSFFPYKVVWEAYGKISFNPKIFSGQWQANQSLQAFIPVKQKNDAKKLLSELSNPAIESYLLSMKMGGTMNWAQPGKIKKLIQIKTT